MRSLFFKLFAATLFGAMGVAHGAGLGAIDVRSAIGQPFHATVQVTGAHFGAYGAHCAGARIESLEGVILAAPHIEVGTIERRTEIHVRTKQAIGEPAVRLAVTITCEESVQRSYDLLLDPPDSSFASGFSVISESRPGNGAALMPEQVSVAKPPVQTSIAASKQAAAASRVSASADSTSNLSRPRAAAPIAPAAQTQARSRQTPGAETRSRSVLRLSPIDDGPVQVQLKFEEELRLPESWTARTLITDVNPSGATDTGNALSSLSGQANTSGVISIEQEITSLQTEINSLRAQNERLQQETLVNQAALDSARGNSSTWLTGIGALIAVCLAAILWLMWRLYAMKKTAVQIPWNEFDTHYGNDLGGETVFSATDLNQNTVAHAAFSDTTTMMQGRFDQAIDDPLPQAGHRKEAALKKEWRTTLSGFFENQPVPAKEAARDTGSEIQSPGLAERRFEPRTKDSPGSSADRGMRKQVMKVEEVSDVMELVETWMALNKPDKVLELLKPFEEAGHPQSPVPLLCLLDVHRAMGDQQKYESILQRIRSKYNVRLAPWEEEFSQDAHRHLSDYPHIVERILEKWNTDSIQAYLDQLIHDKRDGERVGFELSVYRDILRLIALLDDPTCDRSAASMDERACKILFADNVSASGSSNLLARNLGEESQVVPSPHSRSEPEKQEVDEAIVTPLMEEWEFKIDDSGSEKADLALGVSQGGYERTVAWSTTPESLMAPESKRVAEKESASTAAEVAGADLSAESIKFHLAQAYLDIDDVEGAALLLEEVIQNGTPEQSEKARKMLAALNI